MIPVKVAVAIAKWEFPRTDVPALPAVWGIHDARKIFQDRNGWSLGSYWDQCSLGMRSLQFEFFELGTLLGKQEVKQDRGQIVNSALQQCIDKQLFQAGQFEHFIILVSPCSNSAGASGLKDALLDQNASHEFFAHELGHVMGLDHPFGWVKNDEVEYADDFCMMGYTGPRGMELTQPNDPAVTGLFPERSKTNDHVRWFWQSGRMPSPATLFHYWADFRGTPYVQTSSGQPNETVTLTAVSEAASGGPVLLYIPNVSAVDFFVEYRVNSNWDTGLQNAYVVMHSFGANVTNWRGKGNDRIWFDYAIQEPFYDSWDRMNKNIGLEVVAQSADRKHVTVRITRPARVKTATLYERQGRAIIGQRVQQTGLLFLNSENDRSLCSKDGKLYLATIETFGQGIQVDLLLDGFDDPVIEQWLINGQPATASNTNATTTVEMTSHSIVHLPGALGSSLREETQQLPIKIDYQIGSQSIVVNTRPGLGSYTIQLQCTVRDRSMGATEPSAIRVAATEINVVGDRVIYDEDYRKDAERCWWLRTQVPQPVRHWPPSLDDLPWVDPLDKHAKAKLIDRLVLQGIHLPPGPRPLGPGRSDRPAVPVMANTGMSRAQAILTRRVAAALEKGLDARHRAVLSSGFAVHVGENRIHYPDVVVDIAGGSLKDMAATAPALVAEVTSQASAAEDMGDKAAEYLRLPYLMAYLVLSSDEPRAWVWLRNAAGALSGPTVVAGRSGVINIRALDVALHLSDIYQDIQSH